jgi:hypothetical protein
VVLLKLTSGLPFSVCDGLNQAEPLVCPKRAEVRHSAAKKHNDSAGTQRVGYSLRKLGNRAPSNVTDRVALW